MRPWRGTTDPTKMTPKQRELWFRRPEPSRLLHPWLQDRRSYAEHDRDARQMNGRCPMSDPSYGD